MIQPHNFQSKEDRSAGVASRQQRREMDLAKVSAGQGSLIGNSEEKKMAREACPKMNSIVS
jgi:hypothetical protein